MTDPDTSTTETRWLIDGNNVMGSRPDGWWNDREGAMARLTQTIAEWCRTHDDEVVVVFDGTERPAVSQLAGGNLVVRFADRSGRNAADDVIVDLACSGDSVVTADRGLIGRLTEGVSTTGPRSFLELVTPD